MPFHMSRIQILHRRIRVLTWFFILGLVVSGATAIPLIGEVNWLTQHVATGSGNSTLVDWLGRVRAALLQTQAATPFLFYGTD
jgi:hypothetical protein